MTILVTGSAGFIGFHLSRRLLERGETVVGLDNLNPYYDPTLKAARLAILEGKAGYRHVHLDLADRDGVAALFAEARPEVVVNLAAQAGVRYSLESPRTYVDSNVVGFLNILEGCRAVQPRHLVFASSSSVYGANAKLPFDVHDQATHPITLYAATKLANEGMAHAYAHLFGVPATGFRFFTVYGPWGRPDMALFKFTDAILRGEPIDVYGQGRMRRDFTYIDDIVDGLAKAMETPPAANPDWDAQAADPATSSAPWRVLNLAANRPVDLMRYIEVLEDKLGRKAQINLLPMQPGDVAATEADVAETRAVLGYDPKVTVEEGVGRFVDWYRGYYGV
ncbi:MAG: NAD-dependent epimerase/dehydratase family protein [Phenylobacterium sp.]|uniref:NAD-dependent epimerase n=1 Tax=Phenylobacterium sp. TaxID=1871053 RepID=UPI0025F8DBCC|nr:NAD-dependent epimerase [Phenylobacterium sp.]MBI1198491.1 NAD-dependent epimerase/dehydratase family protein [Phenylobacterium sp.]